jgi:heme exporter protein D
VQIGYGTYIWLSVTKLPLQCAVVSLYSVVKQRLKCNTGKVCNCLIQFLLTTVLSIEERVFIIEYVFREGNRYTSLAQEQFAEKFPETPVPHRN